MEVKTQKPTGHLTISERKSTGAHYTPEILSDFVADQIIKALHVNHKMASIKMLDPAVGDGELLISLIKKALGVRLSNFEIHGFDTDPEAINFSKSRIKELFPNIELFFRCEDFLSFAIQYKELSLFSATKTFYDLVIANPPYVRTQVMGAEESKRLSRLFNLAGRVDLYFAFIEGIASILKPGGVAGIIVSNRFMKTKAGESVRKGIKDKFDILHVWDLGDTKIFEAAVLPAVLLLKKKERTSEYITPRMSSIYLSKAGENNKIPVCETVINALDFEGLVRDDKGQYYDVQHGELAATKTSKDIWRISSKHSDSWLKKVKKNTYCVFGDVGKIRVGVKTCADKIFIKTTSDWGLHPTPELLKPLITHHISRRYKALDFQSQILYPHEVVKGTRQAVDLESYPNSKEYLLKHFSDLDSRDYVKEAGRKWYEIWVPQDPSAWKLPKVVFRDISETPTFWMDTTGAVVNGDCYWLAPKNKEGDELLWLVLAVGNSTFIEKFYDMSFNNKLYAGRRRFITQYVKNFPVPDPQLEISQKMISLTKEIFRLLPSEQAIALESELDKLTWKAFDLSVE